MSAYKNPLDQTKKYLIDALYAREESMRQTGRTSIILEEITENDILVVSDNLQASLIRTVAKKEYNKNITVVCAETLADLGGIIKVTAAKFKDIPNVYVDNLAAVKIYENELKNMYYNVPGVRWPGEVFGPSKS